ncbi:hypothetical protein EUGRSUZ_F02387 [Eucalyptus grandis]|uniref:Uncharacterized protein n=2 Tax=Eucalyptus grandis TaxID=71139 RepID=A0ACC3KG80_EUCGR|nr:hypothetical protein EUGRSUZ_F02387 [Eucalyptus grandis]
MRLKQKRNEAYEGRRSHYCIIGDGRYGMIALTKIFYNSIFGNFEGSIFLNFICLQEKLPSTQPYRYPSTPIMHLLGTNSIKSCTCRSHSHPLSRSPNEIIYSTSHFKITTVDNTYFLLHPLKKQAMWRKISLSS